MWTVETAQIERPYPGKDHDRLFADTSRNIFGVFDGAGNHFASDLAISTLNNLVNSGEPFNPVRALNQIHENIFSTFKGSHLTTGSVIQLENQDEAMLVTYASAGDSMIFEYLNSSHNFRALTVEESERKEHYIDASNFLGSSLHILRQFGRFALNETTTFVLVSDGITDEYFDGHLKPSDIRAGLRTNRPLLQTCTKLMDQTAEFDDATMLIVRASID